MGSTFGHFLKFRSRNPHGPGVKLKDGLDRFGLRQARGAQANGPNALGRQLH